MLTADSLYYALLFALHQRWPDPHTRWSLASDYWNDRTPQSWNNTWLWGDRRHCRGPLHLS